MIKDMCRNFAETELKPTAGKNDQNHTFPGNEIKKLGELGMMGVSVATDYGGSGSTLSWRVLDTWNDLSASLRYLSKCISLSIHDNLYLEPLFSVA